MKVTRIPLIISSVAVLALLTAAHVPSLTADTFDKHIADNEFVLVKFFAPWCGHCKSMVEDFKKAAAELQGQASLADVDATVEKELAQEYGIKGFPSLKVFMGGSFLADYQGPRDKDSMVKYMQKLKEPMVVHVASKDEFEKLINDAPEKPYVVIAKPEPLQANNFKKVALELRDSTNTIFVATTDLFVDSVTPKGATIFANDIILVPPASDNGQRQDFQVFNPDNEELTLTQFVRANMMPLVGTLNRETASMYVEANAAVLALFVDKKPTDKQTQVMTTLANALKAEKTKTLFAVYVDKVELASFLEYVGLKGKDPAVAIYSFKDDAKFVLPQSYKFTSDDLIAFAKDYTSGKLKPAIKSAPIPQTNNEPVKVVVGDSWNDIVMDPSKDVLIEQYAPWCGHCKKLTPIYDELAKKVANVHSLVIAKMDATENDAPSGYKAKGFPTLHFFPAGENKKGIAYEGAREVDAFIAFLKNKATHPVNLSDDDDKQEL